jgi:hypothetical protein
MLAKLSTNKLHVLWMPIQAQTRIAIERVVHAAAAVKVQCKAAEAPLALEDDAEAPDDSEILEFGVADRDN